MIKYKYLIIRRIPYLLISVLLFSFFCEDNNPTIENNENDGAAKVVLSRELPECNSSTSGQLYYLMDTDRFVYCDGESIRTIRIVNDTNKVDTLVIFDSTFIYDTVYSFDTVSTIDTLIIKDTSTIFDTVLNYDTLIVKDTVSHIDTVYRIDTILIKDSVFSFDTIYFGADTLVIYDSVIINDTTVNLDTIYSYDTVHSYDTIFSKDTVYVENGCKVHVFAGQFSIQSDSISYTSSRWLIELPINIGADWGTTSYHSFYSDWTACMSLDALYANMPNITGVRYDSNGNVYVFDLNYDLNGDFWKIVLIEPL